MHLQPLRKCIFPLCLAKVFKARQHLNIMKRGLIMAYEASGAAYANRKWGASNLPWATLAASFLFGNLCALEEGAPFGLPRGFPGHLKGKRSYKSHAEKLLYTHRGGRSSSRERRASTVESHHSLPWSIIRCDTARQRRVPTTASILPRARRPCCWVWGDCSPLVDDTRYTW